MSAEPNTVGIVVVDGWVGRFIEINRRISRYDEVMKADGPFEFGLEQYINAVDRPQF